MAKIVNTLDLCDEYASSGDSDTEDTPVIITPQVVDKEPVQDIHKQTIIKNGECKNVIEVAAVKPRRPQATVMANDRSQEDRYKKPIDGRENVESARQGMRGVGEHRGNRNEDNNPGSNFHNKRESAANETRGFNGNRGRGGDRPNGRNDADNGCEETVVRVPKYIPPAPSTDESVIFGQNISSGINFEKYDKIPIKVTGDNVPVACNKFCESGLHEILLENVRKSGYKQPTPVQKHAIPALLAHRDLMACAQTGSGKTASFLLPLLHLLLEKADKLQTGYPQAVIMSPTRELAIQISMEANKFAINSGLKICLLYGGTSTQHQARLYNTGCHVLVATPGRLLDFMEMGQVSYRDCKFIVLDEADRMLDMGFLPAVDTVMSHKTWSTQHRQTLMFSATFPEEIQRLAGKFLNDYLFLAVGTVGGACADVDQVILEVDRYEKRVKLLDMLNEGDCSGTLIFVETKRSADFLAVLLSETELPTTSIHGDRTQQQREEALADFKANRMKILIATSVAARGLDIKNVQHVINFDMPKSIDEYVHRIGRTGRVGNKGRATSFFDIALDADVAAPLVRILDQADQRVPQFLKMASANGMGQRQNNDMRFGGRDVRTHRKPVTTQPTAQEPEEKW